MNTVFSLSERGTSFATRTRAAEVVKELGEFLTLGPTKELTIDLTGVVVISPSFAVAFIGELRSLLSHPEYRMESINIVSDSPWVQVRLYKALEQHVAYVKNSKPLDRVVISELIKLTY